MHLKRPKVYSQPPSILLHFLRAPPCPLCLCGSKKVRKNSFNMKTIFITGIGTGVGKTVVASIITEALQAAYWKPIQAGFDEGTDALTVKDLISNTESIL